MAFITESELHTLIGQVNSGGDDFVTAQDIIDYKCSVSSYKSSEANDFIESSRVTMQHPLVTTIYTLNIEVGNMGGNCIVTGDTEPLKEGSITIAVSHRINGASGRAWVDVGYFDGRANPPYAKFQTGNNFWIAGANRSGTFYFSDGTQWYSDNDRVPLEPSGTMLTAAAKSSDSGYPEKSGIIIYFDNKSTGEIIKQGYVVCLNGNN